jgi:hypothetical protein
MIKGQLRAGREEKGSNEQIQPQWPDKNGLIL